MSEKPPRRVIPGTASRWAQLFDAETTELVCSRCHAPLSKDRRPCFIQISEKVEEGPLLCGACCSHLRDGCKQCQEPLIYWAAPLFTRIEKDFNLKATSELEAAGYRVFLPQRDAGLLAEGRGPDVIQSRDIHALKNCDGLVLVLDNEDFGAAFECGYVKALGKPCFIFTTDARRPYANGNHPLLCGFRICRDVSSVVIELNSTFRST